MKLTVVAFVAVVTLRLVPPPMHWGNAASENGQVCLDLPNGLVDWTALAIASLGTERFRHPSRDVLRAGLGPEQGNSVVVPFHSAVPSVVNARTWVVLYRGGAVAVHPTELRGSVVYFVNSKLALTQAPVAEGSACGDWTNAQAAAFFGSDITLGDIRLTDGAVRRSGPDTFSITADGQTSRFGRPDFVTAGASHVTLYRTDRSETLALIEWDPGDGSTCGHEFTLLTLVPAGSRPPLHNGYDCDV